MQSLYVVGAFVQKYSMTKMMAETVVISFIISDPRLGYLEPKKQKLYHIGLSSLTRKAP